MLQLPAKTASSQRHFTELPPFKPNLLNFLHTLVYDNHKHDNVSKFKMKFLAQPWNTLFIIINGCTTAKVTGLDGTTLITLQIRCGIIANMHIDYASLIWEDMKNQ